MSNHFILACVYINISFVLQSQLTIASDKSRGILGKCDLDMAKFSYDDFNVLRLNIGEC